MLLWCMRIRGSPAECLVPSIVVRAGFGDASGKERFQLVFQAS